MCHECYRDENPNTVCRNCKQREFIFEGDDCVEQFINFVDTYRSWVGRKMRVISHNFKGYDANFVIKELMKRNRSVEPTLNGQKILTIKYNQYIQFIDSLNYLPMPLSNFNSAFGLNPDIYGCKGFSPYMFNTKANWNYEGVIPSIEYFDLTRFNHEKQEEFFNWHSSLVKDNYVYNQRRIDKLLFTRCTSFTGRLS